MLKAKFWSLSQNFRERLILKKFLHHLTKMMTAAELLTELELWYTSDNHAERNDEHQRLFDLTARVNLIYDQRVEECRINIALVCSTEERPVNINPYTHRTFYLVSTSQTVMDKILVPDERDEYSGVSWELKIQLLWPHD